MSKTEKVPFQVAVTLADYPEYMTHYDVPATDAMHAIRLTRRLLTETHGSQPQHTIHEVYKI